MKHRNDDEMRKFLYDNSEKITECGCWIWLNGVDKDGYGQTWYRGKNIRAHRASYMLHVGEILSSHVIMHTCDVTACINPYHLKQATQKYNNDDKMIKGRHRVARGDEHYTRKIRYARAGEKCPVAKLSETEIIEIRYMFSSGIKQKVIAEKFNISRTCVSSIVTRRNWQHI